jgi:LPPG:FO 2-phospho-L-lactate transferase
VLAPGALTVIVNTGDDFVHWGLSISPDLDTVMYTLAGLSDDERGWGLRDETFRVLEGVRCYGGEDWFMLGDRDLATHLARTQGLSQGRTLSDVTTAQRTALGVHARILPMADDPCRTMVDTEGHGTLGFQEWFVRHRAPPVKRVWFEGDPPPSEGVLSAIEGADLVLVGPSNPFVSIDPILSRPGVRSAIAERPVVAVSPIVGGRAIKGPLAEMLPRLVGEAASAGAIARHYGPLLSGIVVDCGDEGAVADVPVLATQTVMRTVADRARLAREVLAFASALESRSP